LLPDGRVAYALKKRWRDGDGIGDVCDAEESRMTERFVWLPWLGMALVGGLLTAMFIQVRRRA
jgi:hypothetical protein